MRTVWHRTIGLVSTCLLLGTLFVTGTVVPGTANSGERTITVMFDGPYPYPPIPW